MPPSLLLTYAGLGGLILAGGRSSRFGTEKALAELDGIAMIAHVLAVLRPHCAATAISASRGSGAAAWAEGLGLKVLGDPGGLPAGPLAGVAAGLAWARAQGLHALVTAPCDTPFLPASLVPLLVASSAGMTRPAVASVAGTFQPLCALWPVAVLERLRENLAVGHPPVHAYLQGLGAVAVSFTDLAAFVNVNTRDDLRRLPGGGDAGADPMGE